MSKNQKHPACSHRLQAYALWCGGLLLGWAGYLLLAGSVSPAQVTVGGLLAAGSLALAAQFAGFARLDLRLPPRRVLSALLALFRQLLPDVWRVSRDLGAHLVHFTRPRGRFRRLPLDAGGQGPQSVGQRALLLFAASWTPNTIAVCIDDPGELVLHQLVSAAPKHSSDRAWPI
ncbi:MAG TPA: hypothetical protein VHY91_04535 [Pirellulales bacterium]|jgi:hypothetical protein|nr:hypothetical protein [Pirellulales bacterium]